MAIITRQDKGSALSYIEMDNNLNELDKIPNGKVYPNTKGVGIKISGTTSDFGWHDIIGNVTAGQGTSTYQTYIGGIKQAQFAEGEDAFIGFHMPHDYLPNSPIFIHTHWSHNSSVVTGGTVTWAFETIYAKGHNQSAFEMPVIISVIQEVSTTAHQHMIAETVASTIGGSAGLLDTDKLEVDGIIQTRVYLDSNDIKTSNATIVKPFIHFVDIHYQSTGLPTKNRAPNFWG